MHWVIISNSCHTRFGKVDIDSIVVLFTSERPMRCMEHQDEFIRVVYLVGDEDERGKSLSANVERGAGIFLQNFHSLLSIRQI